MPNFALLNNVDHQDLKVITTRGEQYGDNVMYALTFPYEFRNVQAHYPILFQADSEGGLFPIALFGFEKGENLFAKHTDWASYYLPAMMRRDPFLIGFQEQQTAAGVAERVRVLSIDLDHPRVSTDEGEALFQPLGGRSPYLEQAADLLEEVYLGLEHCKAFTKALQEHDLVESVTMEITLDDGTKNQLIGFQTLADEKINDLPATVLESFAREGFLLPLFMVVASMSNIQTLISMKNRTLSEAEVS